MTSFEIYLLLLATPVKVSMTILFFIGALILIIVNSIIRDTNNFRSVEENNEIISKLNKKTKMYSVIIMAIGLLALLMPSTETLIIVNVAPKVINNETVQVLPDKLLQYLDSKLDAEIKSLKAK